MELTGLARVTLQPSAGAQGELAGILMVRRGAREAGQSARDGPDPRLRARHESRVGALRRLQGPGAQVERTRHARPSRARGGDDRGRRGAHADGAQHARHLRGPDHSTSPRIVHAKGGYLYCDGANFNSFVGHRQAGRHGHRRDAHEPAQDLLDAARRRRPGLRPGRRGRAARAVPSAPDRRAAAGRHVHARLRPARIDRPPAHVPRQLRDVRARARLHRRVREPDRRGRARRRPERQLHPRRSVGTSTT